MQFSNLMLLCLLLRKTKLKQGKNLHLKISMYFFNPPSMFFYGSSWNFSEFLRKAYGTEILLWNYNQNKSSNYSEIENGFLSFLAFFAYFSKNPSFFKEKNLRDLVKLKIRKRRLCTTAFNKKFSHYWQEFYVVFKFSRKL